MKTMLLMSSSRKGTMGYLEHATDQLTILLENKINRVLFIPYAGVTFSFDEYEARVRPVYEKFGVELISIHRFSDPVSAVKQAMSIAVGGGNTFVLLKRLYDNNLIELVRERVNAGLPYMGWSAGTNVCCPTICTTNDMPVVQPPSLKAFNLVPFQINPHFISGKPVGHNGESREERLQEYLVMNPGQHVIAIREGSALHVQGDKATLLGGLDALMFLPREVVTIAPDATFALDTVNKRI